MEGVHVESHVEGQHACSVGKGVIEQRRMPENFPGWPLCFPCALMSHPPKSNDAFEASCEHKLMELLIVADSSLLPRPYAGQGNHSCSVEAC